MKFFFPELGFCFGATGITPDTETSSSSTIDVPTTRPRGVRRVSSSSKNWKPDLSAIAEDGGVLNVSRSSHESVSVTKSEKKTMNKAKKARSRSYTGDYRKFTHTMAIPAFSPTPFVF